MSSALFSLKECLGELHLGPEVLGGVEKVPCRSARSDPIKIRGKACEFTTSSSSGCLSADHDALAAGRGWNLVVFGGGAAGVLIGVAAAGATTVELDPVTAAGDPVALTRALGAVGVVGETARHRGWAGRV
jgi:hypothetical protein